MTQFNEDSFAVVHEQLRPYLYTQGKAALSELLGPVQRAGFTVRVVRGQKMRDKSRLFDEFSAAFQFPLHFGENWDGFYDCVSDLEWLESRSGYVVVIVEPELVLLDAAQHELEVFLDVMKDAAASFATPADYRAHSEPIPFHVLAVPTDMKARRLSDWERTFGPWNLVG